MTAVFVFLAANKVAILGILLSITETMPFLPTRANGILHGIIVGLKGEGK